MQATLDKETNQIMFIHINSSYDVERWKNLLMTWDKRIEFEIKFDDTYLEKFILLNEEELFVVGDIPGSRFLSLEKDFDLNELQNISEFEHFLDDYIITLIKGVYQNLPTKELRDKLRLAYDRRFDKLVNDKDKSEVVDLLIIKYFDLWEISNITDPDDDLYNYIEKDFRYPHADSVQNFRMNIEKEIIKSLTKIQMDMHDWFDEIEDQFKSGILGAL